MSFSHFKRYRQKEGSPQSGSDKWGPALGEKMAWAVNRERFKHSVSQSTVTLTFLYSVPFYSFNERI